MGLGYRIEYGPGGAVMRPEKRRDGNLLGLTLGFFLLFCSVSSHFWPEKWQRVSDYLIPGDPAVTRAAFSELTAQLHSGSSVEDAVVAFCREIVDGAENPG